MKGLFIWIRNALVQLKVYMSRTGSYISLVNTALLLFLFLSNLERYRIDIRIEDWIVPIFLVGLSGMILFGYLEDRLGFYAQELKATQSRSPYMNDIIERLDRIDSRLDKFEKRR